MTPWAYFNRPTNMAFHDLTTWKKPPRNLRSLLGLSLKFIPNPKYNLSWADYEEKTLPRFERDLKIKTFMAEKLHEDPDSDASDECNPHMYVKSEWLPPEKVFPFPKELPRRIKTFKSELKKLVQKRRAKSNLLPHQKKALRYLRTQ